MPDVRYGSKADIEARPSDVRFDPNSGHRKLASITLGGQLRQLGDVGRAVRFIEPESDQRQN